MTVAGGVASAPVPVWAAEPGGAPAREVNRFGPGLLIVAVALLALGFGVAVTCGLWPDLAGRVVAGNVPDAMHYSWWLGHTPRALWNGRTPFQSSDLNWPIGVSAMNNTSLLLPAVLLAPITWAATSLASLNVLNTLAVPACAAAGYWALRQLRWDGETGPEQLSRPSALVGAATFAISPAIVNSLVGHITMAFAPAMPILVVLSVAAWSGNRTRRTGILLGSMATAQMFIGEEVLFQSLLAALLIILVAALSRPRAVPAAAKRLLPALTTAFAIFLPIAAYPLYLQFFGPLKEHGTPFPATYFGADVTAFSTPTRLQLLHSTAQAAASAKFHGGIEEHPAYLGWPLLITCLLTAVLGWRRLPIRCAAVALLTAMILSLGALIWVNGVSTRRQGPYAAIAQLPVIEGALPTRFGLLAALFAGTLLAFAVHGLSTAGVRRGSPATGALLATGLSLACLAPLTPSPLPVVVAAAVPTYFVTTARHLPRNSVIMVLPFPGPDHPVAMRWQAAAHYGFRMPGGYFLGPDADGHAYIDGHTWSATGGLLRSVARNGLPAVVTINRRHQVAADLRTWGVDRVVLGPDPAQAALRVTVSALLNAQPNHVGGVDVWTLRGPTGKSALQHCDPPPFLLCTVPPLVNE